MTIISHLTRADVHLQVDGFRYVSHYFTDHLGKIEKIGPRKVASDLGEMEYAVMRNALSPQIEAASIISEVEAAISRAYDEINPDIVPAYQTQAEFDRRVLGRMMLITNANVFYAAYPMFQSMQSRGGANANQRAVYLGITLSDYKLIETRFNNVNGVAFFLTDQKNQIFDELPEIFI